MLTQLGLQDLKERGKKRLKRKLPVESESSNLSPRGREGQPEAEGKYFEFFGVPVLSAGLECRV